MMEFDPNARREPKPPEWGTYMPGRKPVFKVHNNRGQALNAMTYELEARPGILYRYYFDANQWREVFRTENWKKSEECEICDTNLLKHFDRSSWNSGRPTWVDKETSPRLITLCSDCYRSVK